MGNNQTTAPPPPSASAAADVAQQQQRRSVADDAHIEAAIESVRLEDHISRLRTAAANTHNGRRRLRHSNLPNNPTTSDNNNDDNDDTTSSAQQQQQQQHNFGQPIYNKSGASKQVTDCRIQQRASLACIEENYRNKDQACARYFDEYKQCRREEHERKLEANANRAW